MLFNTLYMLQNDTAVIVDKSDCNGDLSDNVKSGPVQISSSMFNFGYVARFSQATGSLCWCYDCYSSPTTDFSSYNTKIADVNGLTVAPVTPSSAIIGRLSTSLMILLALTVLKL
eukprot:GHVL01026388.1.p1 GENE.GHVL01026388.1~~GHVL01026388.1.p1  ORF type:complete len:115 (+),score=12.64 GHVL01026388.1:292-636(+)